MGGARDEGEVGSAGCSGGAKVSRGSGGCGTAERRGGGEGGGGRCGQAEAGGDEAVRDQAGGERGSGGSKLGSNDPDGWCGGLGLRHVCEAGHRDGSTVLLQVQVCDCRSRSLTRTIVRSLWSITAP